MAKPESSIKKYPAFCAAAAAFILIFSALASCAAGEAAYLGVAWAPPAGWVENKINQNHGRYSISIDEAKPVPNGKVMLEGKGLLEAAFYSADANLYEKSAYDYCVDIMRKKASGMKAEGGIFQVPEEKRVTVGEFSGPLTAGTLVTDTRVRRYFVAFVGRDSAGKTVYLQGEYSSYGCAEGDISAYVPQPDASLSLTERDILFKKGVSEINDAIFSLGSSQAEGEITAWAAAPHSEQGEMPLQAPVPAPASDMPAPAEPQAELTAAVSAPPQELKPVPEPAPVKPVMEPPIEKAPPKPVQEPASKETPESAAPGKTSGLISQSKEPKKSYEQEIPDKKNTVAVAPLWHGEWQTEWGKMKLFQKGREVTGVYEHNKGRFHGTTSADGKTLKGRWREQPDYTEPKCGGRAVFNLFSDGKSFSGQWWYGDDKSGGPWNGKKLK